MENTTEFVAAQHPAEVVAEKPKTEKKRRVIKAAVVVVTAKCARCNETEVPEEGCLCGPCADEHSRTETARMAEQLDEEPPKEEKPKKAKKEKKAKAASPVVEAVVVPPPKEEELEMKAVPVKPKQVGIARTLAKSKDALTDECLAGLLEEADGDLKVALTELVAFRQMAEEKRLKANEASKKSKGRKAAGGGDDTASADGEGAGERAPKETKAMRDAKMIAAMTADAVCKKMREED